MDDKHYADTIIKNFNIILNCIGKIKENTPNYDYIVDLSEIITKQLKNIADQGYS